MKWRSFEDTLPEGYVPRLTVDCQDKKLGILMNLAALAIMAVLCVVFWRLIQPWDAFLAAPLTSLLKTAVFMVAVSAYIVLHELLHGAAYKLLTGRKLTFGLTWSVAYCGVPDIFVYRSAALVALLAPFVVFTVVFLLAELLIADPVSRYMAAFLLATHSGGCVGDLYDTGLYLFRLRDSDTLMQDTGPKQTFYTRV